MKTYTAWEYLLIDVANQWGEDKVLFEDRIRWTREHLDKLELMAEERGHWKEKPLYLKAVMAVRKVQKGLPTGHMVGLDAVCGGLQVMATVTGCYEGGKATGLVDTGERPDAYTKCLEIMREEIPNLPKEERAKIKKAVMTTFYGSSKVPEELFGKGTKELAVFYRAIKKLSPGAVELLNDLLNAWQPYSLQHSWTLPDNHHVHIKNMETIVAKIEVDELQHSKFITSWQENIGVKKGLSLAANVVHSIDAYVLRSLIRRCSYDPHQLVLVQFYIHERLKSPKVVKSATSKELEGLLAQYKSTNIVDLSIVQYLNAQNVWALSVEHAKRLQKLIEDVLNYPPFPIITVHDEFKCHATNVNRLRYHYKEILADLADGNVLDSIFSSILGTKCTYQKITNDLSKYIRKSNYTLC